MLASSIAELQENGAEVTSFISGTERKLKCPQMHVHPCVAPTVLRTFQGEDI
jgi:hypothetical protein